MAAMRAGTTHFRNSREASIFKSIALRGLTIMLKTKGARRGYNETSDCGIWTKPSTVMSQTKPSWSLASLQSDITD